VRSEKSKGKSQDPKKVNSQWAMVNEIEEKVKSEKWKVTSGK